MSHDGVVAACCPLSAYKTGMDMDASHPGVQECMAAMSHVRTGVEVVCHGSAGLVTMQEVHLHLNR